MINQNLIKQLLPLILFLLYLIMRNSRIGEKIINTAIYLLPTIYLCLTFIGYKLIEDSWRTIATPLQYTLFFWLIYNQHQNRPYYSLALASNTTTFVGYLYEIPRYFVLQGIRGLIRFNKYSLFRIDYAILSIIPITYLLWGPIRLNKTKLTAITVYLITDLIYITQHTAFYNLKYAYAWLWSIRVPWICFLRIPAMYLVYSFCMKAGINFYTGINNYTNNMDGLMDGL